MTGKGDKFRINEYKKLRAGNYYYHFLTVEDKISRNKINGNVTHFVCFVFN